MKLLKELEQQVQGLPNIRRAWFTTFTLDVGFFEKHVLPVLLGMDAPTRRSDYERMQQRISEDEIDVRIFCDERMLDARQVKQTAIPIHGLLPSRTKSQRKVFDDESLFHPKVVFIQDEKGRSLLGAGSANLTVSGWGRNQECFAFREVSSRRQYRQVHDFFDAIQATVPGDRRLSRPDEVRGLKRGDRDWAFVHSYSDRDFLEILLKDLDSPTLSVWSPYFSADLPTLLRRIRNRFDEKLPFAIVPDRAADRTIRTRWTDALEQMLAEESLTFHDRPTAHDTDVEMTHAKLWQANDGSSRSGRIGIGSWNCTEPGSASFERRNVEAGIILPLTRTTPIIGKPMVLNEADFATAEALEEEALKPLNPISPVDLQVVFDWQDGTYQVNGEIHGGGESVSYALRLPGVASTLPLQRSSGTSSFDTLRVEIKKSDALLIDHAYEVWVNEQMIHRGLVQEINLNYRRGFSYDSLGDLLDDLSNETEPEESMALSLRSVLRDRDEANEASDKSGDVLHVGNMTYFRMFRAFEAFRRKLADLAKADWEALEQLLFTRPGCLHELVGKVNEHVDSSTNQVMNWLLLKELHALWDLAGEKRDQRRTEPKRWNELKPRNPDEHMPAFLRGADATARKRLLEEGGYAT